MDSAPARPTPPTLALRTLYANAISRSQAGASSCESTHLRTVTLGGTPLPRPLTQACGDARPSIQRASPDTGPPGQTLPATALVLLARARAVNPIRRSRTHHLHHVPISSRWGTVTATQRPGAHSGSAGSGRYPDDAQHPRPRRTDRDRLPGRVADPSSPPEHRQRILARGMGDITRLHRRGSVSPGQR
jgi:hypothetical protein